MAYPGQTPVPTATMPSDDLSLVFFFLSYSLPGLQSLAQELNGRELVMTKIAVGPGKLLFYRR